MWAHVLGASAGGGFPQWNCNCPVCQQARRASVRVRPATASSLAVSADRERWFLIDASPDIHRQIAAFSALWPRNGVRHTPIQAIMLTDAELDHTAGLLSLREAQRLRILATEWVHTALVDWNPILRTLDAFCTVEFHPLHLNEPLALLTNDGTDSGLCCEAFSTGGSKQVAFAPAGSAGHPEASVGLRITETRTKRVMVYMPAVESLNASVLHQLRDCACVFIDGTCWTDDEMVSLGISSKTSHQMGHLPVGGNDGSLAVVSGLDVARKIYIHIDNTNPMLLEDSAQRKAVHAAGVEVAQDGLEIEV
jgi:pyrroloquinoline quinone biosynthesis protein B